MADPFTIAVSVAGLTSLGIQLLQSLNKYAGSALDSKGRITAISTDIGLAVQVFQTLETTIQDEANRAMMNDDAERLAREAIDQCRKIFENILSTLPMSGPDGPKLMTKITYPRIEPKLELLRGNLEKVKTTLQLLMNVIIFAAMSKRHAEQASLNQLQLEIEKLLEDKARAEARLEVLERDHAEDLDARMPALPTSAQSDLLPVPQKPGATVDLVMIRHLCSESPIPDEPFPVHENFGREPVVNVTATSHSSLFMEEQPPGAIVMTIPERNDEQNPTLTSEPNACHATVPLRRIVTMEPATVYSSSILSAESDSPIQRGDIEAMRADKSTTVHLSRAQAAIPSPRLQSKSVSEMGKLLSPSRSVPHESETADFMVNLHDDYTACLRQLQTFQSQLEQALQNMYVPTVGIPVVKPDLNVTSRREMIDAVHMAARQTSDFLNQHILRTSVKQNRFQETQEEARAKRGERSMGRLFDTNADPYDYNTLVEDQPLADLPIRDLPSDRGADKETLVDLDMGAAGLDSQPTFNFDFSDVPRLKAARPCRLSMTTPNDKDDEDQNDFYDGPDQDTLPLTSDSDRRSADWTFATAEPASNEPDAEPDFSFPPTKDETDIALGFRPHLTRTATKPIGQSNDFLHSSNIQSESWPRDYNRRMDACTRQQLLDGLLTSANASPDCKPVSVSQLNANDPIGNTASEIEPDITRIIDPEKLPTVNDLLRRWTNLKVPVS